MTKVFIISNESIQKDKDNFYCDNIDLKSIPEGLNNNIVSVDLLARNSKFTRSKKIKIDNIYIGHNIFSYIAKLLKSFKKKNNYLIISISPYTFVAVVFLKLFNKKNYVYLRSDGYKEYKSIFGFCGSIIYHFMFYIVSRFSSLIACRKHLLRGKLGKIVNPSQLNKKWFEENKITETNKIKLLYVGRVRIEKGIYSLIDMIKGTNIKLTIVTAEKNIILKKLNSNINLISFENYHDSIIEFYDNHNILILPSYTEAHPQVLDEALARVRPVIIFKEIEHVIRNRKGVFACDRSLVSLKETIDYILKNYPHIQNEIKKNILPTKSEFIKEIKNIILSETNE